VPVSSITWWFNGNQIGRENQDKNYKIFGKGPTSQLYIGRTSFSPVPRASEKEGQVRLDHSPAPTQLALLSPICFPRSKRPIAATRVTLNDSTPQ
jgi:hypothetical protein